MDPKIQMIKLETDIASLKMRKMPWDTYLYNHPFQVVAIDDYYHCIGGKYGNNNFWAYPRNAEPTYDNLVPFDGYRCCWGIQVEPKNYLRTKWGDNEILGSCSVTITRNGEEFLSFGSDESTGILKARLLITELQEHPIPFNNMDYEEEIVGRKVWWHNQPVIVTRYIKGQAAVILEREDGKPIDPPPMFANDDMFCPQKDIKEDILSKNIYWFRSE